MDVTIILMYQSSLFTAAQVSSIFKSMRKVRVKAAIWLHLLLGHFRQNTLKLGVYAEFPLPRTAPLLVHSQICSRLHELWSVLPKTAELYDNEM